MLPSLLVIAAVAALLYGYKRWHSLPDAERKSFGKKFIIYAAVGLVLGLVVAGRAHWLMGVLAALLALAGRVAQFAQYAPLFKKFFGEAEEQTKAGASSVQASSEMSKQEAADILGIELSASPEEIRTAHKKLMQKLHPDRGGSDALAKQINQAKKVMLR